MSAHASTRRVHWGDCAPSGAVFYPIYFHWFDEAAWNLFESLELPIGELGRRHGVVGLPLAGCESRFLRPVRLGDTVDIVSAVIALDASRGEIQLEHLVRQGSPGGELAVAARERRFWGVRHETDPARLRRGALPDAVRDRLAAAMSAPAVAW